MKTKIPVLLCLLIGAAAVLILGQEKALTPEKPVAQTGGALVRMDLLKKKEREAAVVKRDIFVPFSLSEAAEELPPGVREKLPTPEDMKAAEELQEAVLSVRYVGYIQARQKIIALILFEEKATAVEEGDMLGEIGKVTKITSGEIEIQGPDGKSQRFVLEGEQK